MKKRSNVTAQVMLYVVLGLLFVFLATGVYFLTKGLKYPELNTIPAGCIGIGVFCIGMGVVLFLQADLLKAPKDSFWKTFGLHYEGSKGKAVESLYDVKTLQMQFGAEVEVNGIKGSGTVLLFADALVVQGLQDAELVMKRTDVQEISREKCVLEIHNDTDTWMIVSDNALRVKVLEEKLRENK